MCAFRPRLYYCWRCLHWWRRRCAWRRFYWQRDAMRRGITWYRLSYGREALCVLAGPLINGTLSWLLSLAGARREELYIFAGAQLILGVFNLLPLWTLDGGRLLWIAIAWLTDPFLADKVCRMVTAALLLALAALGIGLWVRYRSGFLLVGVVGIICCTGREFMLANQTGRG